MVDTHGNRADGSTYEVAIKFALTGAAAAAAETATFPIDLVKTRLQVHGGTAQLGASATASGGSTRHVTQVLSAVLRQAGFAGLYSGVGAAVVRHLPYTGVRVLVYEQLRPLARQAAVGGELPASLLAGMVSGAVGQMVAVPADVVKVRLQTQSRAGVPRHYRGLADAFATIARQEGLRGLWAGAVPAVYRAALVNLGELPAYDQAKRFLVRSEWLGGDNAATHAAASGFSGFCAAACSTPADVIKTRMMSQSGSHPDFSSTWDCLVKTVRREGVWALWRGFLPTWARLGPWQLTFWVSYEHLRQLSGLRSF